jgi:biotin transport system substrate-specific component
MSQQISLTLTKENRSWMQDAAIVVGASIIIGLFAPVAIRLPFSPVPIAMQNNVILFLAVLLGSKRATLAVLAFIAQGAMGLPVFAGGNGGILHLVGPTGGYIFGYIASAYVAGWIAERAETLTLRRGFLAMAVGGSLAYVFGVSWLSLFLGLRTALFAGVVPFIVGDLAKLFLFTRGLKTFRRVS